MKERDETSYCYTVGLRHLATTKGRQLADRYKQIDQWGGSPMEQEETGWGREERKKHPVASGPPTKQGALLPRAEYGTSP